MSFGSQYGIEGPPGPPGPAGPAGPPGPGGLYVFDSHDNRLAAAHVANRTWKENDNGGVAYVDDGAAWKLWQPEAVLRASLDTNFRNSTTLALVTELALQVEPGEVWEIEARLVLQGSSGTHDWKFGFATPGSTVMPWGLLALSTDAAAGGLVSTTTLTSNPLRSRTVAETVSIPSMSATGNDAQLVQLRGVATITNTGVVQLRGAQNTLEDVDAKLRANSRLVCRRLV